VRFYFPDGVASLKYSPFLARFELLPVTCLSNPPVVSPCVVQAAAIDLMHTLIGVGGLDRVFTKLQELSEKITPQMLIEATTRRHEFIVEDF
jgi:hypothetical protein